MPPGWACGCAQATRGALPPRAVRTGRGRHLRARPGPVVCLAKGSAFSQEQHRHITFLYNYLNHEWHDGVSQNKLARSTLTWACPHLPPAALHAPPAPPPTPTWATQEPPFLPHCSRGITCPACWGGSGNRAEARRVEDPCEASPDHPGVGAERGVMCQSFLTDYSFCSS